jgi:hypothetical protein
MNEACSLIAEAADPDANIIFGSVIDPHAGDEVRITVIATGFQARDSVQPGHGSGRSSSSGGMTRRDQMALPMQPTAFYAQSQVPQYVPQAQQQPQGGPVVNMSTAGVTPPAIPPWAQPTSVAAPTRGYAAAAPAPEAQPGFEEFYDNMEQVPPATISVGQPTPAGGFGVAQATEWTPAERPVIRPPVTNPGASASAPPVQSGRRMQMASRQTDELGVEESEFDKPTYLRRGIFAPE